MNDSLIWPNESLIHGSLCQYQKAIKESSSLVNIKYKKGESIWSYFLSLQCNCIESLWPWSISCYDCSEGWTLEERSSIFSGKDLPLWLYRYISSGREVHVGRWRIRRWAPNRCGYQKREERKGDEDFTKEPATLPLSVQMSEVPNSPMEP